MSLAARVLVLVALAGLLYVTADPGQALVHLLHADPIAIALAIAVSALGVVLSGIKWSALLRARRIELPAREAVGFYWIGMFFSNFLPTSIGGDAIRLTLARDRGGAHDLAASILIERLTGLAVLLLVLGAGLAVQMLVPGQFSVPGWVWLAVLATATGMVLAVLLPRPLRRLSTRIRRHLPNRFGRVIVFGERLLHSLAAYNADRPTLLRAVALSLPFYVTIVVSHIAVLAAVGAQVDPVEVLVAAPLISLIAVIPLVPNGIGVAEGAFVLLYASAGVPAEVALAAALLRRLVDLGNSAIGGAVWAARRRPALRPA